MPLSTIRWSRWGGEQDFPATGTCDRECIHCGKRYHGMRIACDECIELAREALSSPAAMSRLEATV